MGFCKKELGAIVFDPKEVSEVKFVPFTEFKAMLSDPHSGLAPIYKEACADLVYYLGARLSEFGLS